MGQSGLIHSISGRDAHFAATGKTKKYESFGVDRVRPTQFRNFHEMKAESDTRYKSLHKINQVAVTTSKPDPNRVRIQTIESKTMTTLGTDNGTPLENTGTHPPSKIPEEDPNNIIIPPRGRHWGPRKSQNWSSRMVGDTINYERKFDIGPPGFPTLEKKKTATNRDEVLNKLLSDTRQMIRHKNTNIRDWDKIMAQQHNMVSTLCKTISNKQRLNYVLFEGFVNAIQSGQFDGRISKEESKHLVKEFRVFNK